MIYYINPLPEEAIAVLVWHVSCQFFTPYKCVRVLPLAVTETLYKSSIYCSFSQSQGIHMKLDILEYLFSGIDLQELLELLLLVFYIVLEVQLMAIFMSSL